MKKIILWIVAVLAVATLAGCYKTPVENLGEESQIANPASVYCEENSGTLNLEEWLCMFEDGTCCEEWSYYRNECQPWEIIYITVEENEVNENYEVDYGTSEIYSKEDLDSAINAIMNKFNNEWQVRCEMHKIYYAWDERSLEELSRVQISSIAPFTESLVMYSDFHSPVNPEEAGAFEPDYEYMNYNWILWKAEGWDWIVVDSWY